MASSSSSVFCQIGTDFVGDVQRNLRHMRHRLEPRVGADEGFAVGDHARVIPASAVRPESIARSIGLHGIAIRRIVVMDSGPRCAPSRNDESSCPPSSPTAFSAISTSCAPSAPTRPACTGRRFSPDDIAARQLVRRAMHRRRARDHDRRHRQHSGKEQGDAARKALSGSHLESQNHAGWLDGALGCVYALEAARAIRGGGRRCRRRRRGVLRRGRAFRLVPRQSKSFTGLLEGRGHRQGARTSTTARRCAMRSTSAGYARPPARS